MAPSVLRWQKARDLAILANERASDGRVAKGAVGRRQQSGQHAHLRLTARAADLLHRLLRRARLRDRRLRGGRFRRLLHRRVRCRKTRRRFEGGCDTTIQYYGGQYSSAVLCKYWREIWRHARNNAHAKCRGRRLDRGSAERLVRSRRGLSVQGVDAQWCSNPQAAADRVRCWLDAVPTFWLRDRHAQWPRAHRLTRSGCHPSRSGDIRGQWRRLSF